MREEVISADLSLIALGEHVIFVVIEQLRTEQIVWTLGRGGSIGSGRGCESNGLGVERHGLIKRKYVPKTGV